MPRRRKPVRARDRYGRFKPKRTTARRRKTTRRRTKRKATRRRRPVKRRRTKSFRRMTKRQATRAQRALRRRGKSFSTRRKALPKRVFPKNGLASFLKKESRFRKYEDRVKYASGVISAARARLKQKGQRVSGTALENEVCMMSPTARRTAGRRGSGR